jgi:hypothetical protein
MRSAPRTDGRKTSPRWTGGWGKRLSKGGAGCWLWVACPFPGRSADVHRVGRSLASETGAGLERYERYATGGQPPLSRWPPRPSPTGAYTRRAE